MTGWRTQTYDRRVFASSNGLHRGERRRHSVNRWRLGLAYLLGFGSGMLTLSLLLLR